MFGSPIVASLTGLCAVGGVIVGAYYASVPAILGKTDFEIAGVATKARLEWWCCEQGRPFSKIGIISGSGQETVASGWAELASSRASFYLTPENWLIVLTPKAGIVAFRPTSTDVFEDARSTTPKNGHPSEWRYLGAVDGTPTPKPSFRFYSPSEQRECIPMLGVKFEQRARFRLQHQSNGTCNASETAIEQRN